jgi:hypothetical protein
MRGLLADELEHVRAGGLHRLTAGGPHRILVLGNQLHVEVDDTLIGVEIDGFSPFKKNCLKR